MMQTKSDTKASRIYCLVDISQEEKNQAKVLAKSKGMSLQGFMAQLIKRELEVSKSEVVNG